jgi:hypothetical protein
VITQESDVVNNQAVDVEADQGKVKMILQCEGTLQVGV